MNKHLKKPQSKDYGYLQKEHYPEKVERIYEIISEHSDQFVMEDVRSLVDAVYKAAYLDGFKDSLYYQEL